MSAPRGLIVILATVLLLEVGRWSHGEVFALFLKYSRNDLLSQKMVYKRDIPEKGVCNEIESYQVPYYGSGFGPGLYPIRVIILQYITMTKDRSKIKREGETIFIQIALYCTMLNIFFHHYLLRNKVTRSENQVIQYLVDGDVE